MNNNRYYPNIEQAEQQETQILSERLNANNTLKEISFLYVNKQNSRVLAKDSAEGRMVTVAGNGEDSGNYHLTKGVALEAMRRPD